MSRREIGLFLGSFALVGGVCLHGAVLADGPSGRFRRFHASACAPDTNANSFGITANVTDPGNAKASGVLYSKANRGDSRVLCAVDDSNAFRVDEMSILEVFVNDANETKNVTASWCWTAMGGWTGACGSAKSSVAAGTANMPASSGTPPTENTTQRLVWDRSDAANSADWPWAGIRPSGLPYVTVQVPGRSSNTDISVGFVGFRVSEPSAPLPPTVIEPKQETTTSAP